MEEKTICFCIPAWLIFSILWGIGNGVIIIAIDIWQERRKAKRVKDERANAV